MREVFRNTINQQVIITEDGVCFIKKGMCTIIPRDKISLPLTFNFGVLLVRVSIFQRYALGIDIEEDKKRLETVLDTFNPLIGQPVGRELTAADFGVEIIPDDKEIRMYCKTCGHVYCYTMAEYKENERLKKKASTTELCGALNNLFTSMALGSSQNQEAEMMKMRIKDYTRCPKCNSADICKIPDGEPIPVAQNSADPATSGMDELKKLKELLDMGIVTQEEFDAKKKQLLGL